MKPSQIDENPPDGWTPESDADPKWIEIAGLLREADRPFLPGEETWARLKSDVFREAGIGQPVRVLDLEAERIASGWGLSRVLQLAAVGAAAFAVGWILSPASSSSTPDTMEQPSIARAGAGFHEPRPEVFSPGDLGSGRITPTVPSEGVPTLVSSDSQVPGGGRRVVIHDTTGRASAGQAAAESTLAADLVRALRDQSDLEIPPQAVLASVGALLGENPNPGDEASLRYLKAEIHLLEQDDRTAAISEYESVIRLTSGQGPLAERARSRLASLR